MKAIPLLIITIVPAMLMFGCVEGTTSSDISSAASNAGASSSSCSTTYPDKYNYTSKISKYSNDAQCYTQWQNVEAYRQSAIANCAAGDTSAASTYYNNYYPKAASVAMSYCP